MYVLLSGLYGTPNRFLGKCENEKRDPGRCVSDSRVPSSSVYDSVAAVVVVVCVRVLIRGETCFESLSLGESGLWRRGTGGWGTTT
jgi:hypothetical protein